MSLYRTAQPDRWSPVYNPILYEFESSFWNYWIEYSALRVISTITDESGFNKITYGSAHGYEVGDKIIVVDDAFLEYGYTGVQTITSVPSSTTLVTDRGYTSGLSGAARTSKYAADYKMLLEVRALIDGVDTSLGIIEQEPDLVAMSTHSDKPVFSFDIAPILRNYINTTPADYDVHSLTVEGLETNENSYLRYYVKYAEQYSEGVSGETELVDTAYTTDQSASYSTNYKWALNAAFQWDELIGTSYKLEDYLVDGVQDAKWLTDRPSCGTKLKTDGAAFAYFIAETFETSEDWVFKVWTETAAGVQVDVKYDNDHSARVEGSYSWLVNFDNIDYEGAKYIKARMYQEVTADLTTQNSLVSITDQGGFNLYTVSGPITLYIGQKVDIELDGGGGGTFTGAQYVTQVLSTSQFVTDRPYDGPLGAAASAYTYVQDAITEEICWEIDEECSRYEYTLYWLNKKGGYETYTFTGPADTKTDVERIGEIKYNSSSPNRQLSNLYNRSLKSIKLKGKEYDNDVFEWLSSELIESPDIYLLVSGNLIPVNMRTDSMVTLADAAKINLLEFELQFAFERIVQSR